MRGRSRGDAGATGGAGGGWRHCRGQMRRLRRTRATLLLLALLLVAAGAALLRVWGRWEALDLAELDSCPACYGVTMCPAFMGRRVSLTWSVANLLNLVGAKNVYLALLGDGGDGRTLPVVLKKLGHDSELAALDVALCGGGACHAGEAVLRVSDLYTAVESALRPEEGRGVVLCPSPVNLDKLLAKVLARNKGVSRRTVLANVWTLLHINAEPLLLQVIPREEGWPVPRYLGACGRVVVEEYVGEPLTGLHDAPWTSRAGVALRLLVAADNFTNSHPDFRFYLTDVSPDNVAVGTSGEVYFVDLENVVILDKNTPNEERPISWKTPHVSETYDCVSCFAFSTNEICSHYVSDHNFYAVCQQLLAPTASPDLLPGGLLHGVPRSVLDSHPDLPRLLTQCAESPEPLGRVTAAHKLMTLLARVVLEGHTGGPSKPPRHL